MEMRSPFSPHFPAGHYKEAIMSTVMESKVRIQREDFSVTDEIEAIKKSSQNIGGIVVFLGTGRELSKGENITKLNF